MALFAPLCVLCGFCERHRLQSFARRHGGCGGFSRLCLLLSSFFVGFVRGTDCRVSHGGTEGTEGFHGFVCFSLRSLWVL